MIEEDRGNRLIRRAQPEDCAEMARLCVDIRLDSVPTIHPEDEVEGWIRQLLVARSSAYVVECEDQIVGWMDVFDGWVNALYCRRGCTGRGFGRQLLDVAKSICPGGLKLYAFQMNDGARRFYIRERFIEVAFADGSENEEKTSDVLMEWRGASSNDPGTSSVV